MLLVLAVLLICVLLPPASALAQSGLEAGAPQPEAKSDSGEEGEFTAFDLYIGGENLFGSVYGYFGDNWFSPENPDDIIKLLPPVQDAASFRELFTGRVTRRRVEGVGVIRADPSRFRLDLEIAQEQTLLSKVDDLESLAGSNEEFSIQNNLFGATTSTTRGVEFLDSLSLSHDTILSKNTTSFQSTGTASKGSGYSLQNALMKRDFAGLGQALTMAGGLMETTNNPAFAQNREFLGFRLETNREILFRDQQYQGTDLEVFLPRRSQVNIYRDSEEGGELLFTRVLDFGTVQIDTRDFPQGSYNIEIVIDDGVSDVERETRPFTKTQTLTPRGKFQFGFEAGVMRDNIKFVNDPVFAGEFRKRVTDWLDAGIGFSTTSEDHVIEASLRTQSEIKFLNKKGLLETSLTGAVAKISQLAGLEATVGIKGEEQSLHIIASSTFDRPEIDLLPGSLALAGRQSVNAVYATPLSIGGKTASLSLTGEISHSDDTGRRGYRYGPVFRYKLDRRGEYIPELRLEYVHSEDDRRYLATMTFKNDDPVWVRTGELTMRKFTEERSAQVRARLGYNGPGSTEEDWRKNLIANVNMRADPMVSNISRPLLFTGADASYEGRMAQVKAYVEHNATESTGQMGAELNSTMIWTLSNGLSATSEPVTVDSAILALKINGAEDARLGITVNGQARAYGRRGETVFVPLPVYQKSVIGAVETEKSGQVDVKEKRHIVTAYPGNVIYREFTVLKLYFLMGTLVDGKGAPMANYRFSYQGLINYTDDDGLFTVETPMEAGTELQFTGEGMACRFTPKELPEDDVLVDAGNVMCEAAGAAKQNPGQ